MTSPELALDERDWEAILLRYARHDWVVFGDWDRLHHAVELTADVDEWRFVDVVTACGLRRGEAFIPGIFTRMAAERCSHCCDRSGFPRGTGSPKNDDACRVLLDLEPRRSVADGGTT